MTAQSKSSFEFIARPPAKGQPQKLVFLLHGYGKNATLMEKMADAVAGLLPDAHIIMPHAPDLLEKPDDEDGNMLRMPSDVRDDDDSLDSALKRQWFSIAFQDKAKMRTEILSVAARLNKFIDEQRDALGFADGDIAIMGFSQGGGVALYSAYLRDRDVACAIGHSTIFMGDEGLKSKPPTMLLYGKADDEFTQDIKTTQALYQDSARELALFIDDLTVKVIDGLGHTTSHNSRTIVADYIKDKLTL